jgi:hypothetical protein
MTLNSGSTTSAGAALCAGFLVSDALTSSFGMTAYSEVSAQTDRRPFRIIPAGQHYRSKKRS